MKESTDSSTTIAVQVTKALLGIQDSFEAQIDKLRNLDYTVLDVKTSRWHDDYNSFKDVVKDLQVRKHIEYSSRKRVQHHVSQSF